MTLRKTASLLKSESANEDKQKDVNFLIIVATGLWRIRSRMVEPISDKPYDEMQGAFHHLNNLWAAFSQIGLEIKDHTGSVFNQGMALKVLAFEPTDKLIADQIIETIKPSIYINGELRQMGEVVVGTPKRMS